MKIQRAVLLFCCVLLQLTIAAFAQEVVLQTQPTTGPSREEVEQFLRTAEIVDAKKLGTGVTNPLKLTLSDGKVQRYAVYKSIDDRRKGMTRTAKGMEMDFKDSWMFEVAAYQLDKLLGLNMVPVTVERTWDGKKGSVQEWIENAMTEKERRAQNLEPPDTLEWSRQLNKVKLFDLLVYNIDRHAGNLLITNDWRVYMIDHSRSFKTIGKIADAKALSLFSKSLIDSLKRLDERILMSGCAGYLSLQEVKTMLKRRDALVKLYEDIQTSQGETALFP